MRHKELHGIDRAAVETLLEEVRSSHLFTEAELKQLLARRFEQPVVSLYLDLLPEGVDGDPAARVKLVNSMRHTELQARRYLVDGLSAGRRAVLEHDLDELELLAEHGGGDGNRSLVAFKAGGELARAAGLRLPTGDRLVIDVDPFLVPLEVLLEARPSALIVDVGKEESRVSSWRFGELRLLARLEAPPHPESARIGGLKEQRHDFTHLLWHLKKSSETAVRLLGKHGLEHVVLAGEESVLAAFEEVLPEPVSGRVAGRLHPLPEADRGEWEKEIERVLREHRRGEEVAALEQLGEDQGHGRLRGGPAAAVEALNLALAHKLFVSAELKLSGRTCPNRHYLSVEEETRCPLCSSELRPVADFIDELVAFARRHGVELMVVATVPERLDPYRGIAAVTYDLSAG